MQNNGVKIKVMFMHKYVSLFTPHGNKKKTSFLIVSHSYCSLSPEGKPPKYLAIKKTTSTLIHESFRCPGALVSWKVYSSILIPCITWERLESACSSSHAERQDRDRPKCDKITPWWSAWMKIQPCGISLFCLYLFTWQSFGGSGRKFNSR